MLFQLQQMQFGYINGYVLTAPTATKSGTPARCDKSDRILPRLVLSAQSGLARLAQARQNRPGRGTGLDRYLFV